jgi:hypothetical protein
MEVGRECELVEEASRRGECGRVRSGGWEAALREKRGGSREDGGIRCGAPNTLQPRTHSACSSPPPRCSLFNLKTKERHHSVSIKYLYFVTIEMLFVCCILCISRITIVHVFRQNILCS